MDVAANEQPLVISPKTDLFSQSLVPDEYEEALEHQVPAYYLKGPGDDIMFHVDAVLYPKCRNARNRNEFRFLTLCHKPKW